MSKSIKINRHADKRSLRVRGPIAAGALVIMLFFGGLGGWAALAPLESAAIATGAVSVEGQSKTIQHLEGGIVGSILVKEGQLVRKGQVLIKLEMTEPLANRNMLNAKYISALALEARLVAERDYKPDIRYPKILNDNLEEKNVSKAIAGQNSIFYARRKSIRNKVKIEKQNIAQILEEIKGLEGQITSRNIEKNIILDEVKALKTLVEKKISRKSPLLVLQRRLAEVEGDLSKNTANIARARQRINLANTRIEEIQSARLNEVVTEIRKIQAEIFDLVQRVRAAEDVLKRTKITAPLDGAVVDLRVHTLGGGISPGTPLLDIVPSKDKMLIKAQIDPMDIDVVYPGLKALVYLTSFSTRVSKPIEGKVVSVSADRIIDKVRGTPYYLAIVKLTEKPERVFEGAKLHPGMPVEVMIVTGARSTLEYIFKPITSSFNRAFRGS